MAARSFAFHSLLDIQPTHQQGVWGAEPACLSMETLGR